MAEASDSIGVTGPGPKESNHDSEKAWIDIYSLELEFRNYLGESPFWMAETSTVYWVDILKGTINSWHSTTGQTKIWDIKQKVGCVVPVQGETDIVLLASLKGIGLYDLRAKTWFHNYGDPEHKLLTNRWNDGKCGPDGRFWIGSMNHTDTEASIERGERDGSLYVLNGRETNPCFRKQKGYIGISNGIAWSRDGSRMYFIDTPSQSVQEYEYRNRNSHNPLKLLNIDCITIPKEDGAPDGCAMDMSDNLWIALWGGGAIQQYSTATGEKLLSIDIGEKYPTSVAWIGVDLDMLFVTTAKGDTLTKILDDENDAERRDTGQNYIIDFSNCNVRGVPVSGFRMGHIDENV